MRNYYIVPHTSPPPIFIGYKKWVTSLPRSNPGALLANARNTLPRGEGLLRAKRKLDN